MLGIGGNYGWTQNVLIYFNEAQNWYKSLQTKFTRRFSDGWSAQVNYTLQKAEQEQDEYWIYDPDLNKGPAGFDRTHNFTAAIIYELPFGRDKTYGSDWNGVTEALLGGWQLSTNVFILSGTPFDVTYRDARQDRDTGPNRPDLIGDPDGPQTHDEWFNATPIGSPGSAFGRPARGTFGNLRRHQLRGPGFWQADVSFFKNFWLGQAAPVEVRVEAVNIFNHVNLGNPMADRRARQRQPECRPHHETAGLPAAELPVRVPLHVLIAAAGLTAGLRAPVGRAWVARRRCCGAGRPRGPTSANAAVPEFAARRGRSLRTPALRRPGVEPHAGSRRRRTLAILQPCARQAFLGTDAGVWRCGCSCCARLAVRRAGERAMRRRSR